MTISLFCKKDNCVECTLCPNRCRLKEDEVGKCSIRQCDGDTIFLNNYGEFVSVAVNPIEKKPFVNYLPGTKTLSIGGIGCSLSCDFCENHIISQAEKKVPQKKFSVNKLVSIAKDKCCDSICMTFNEPTISFEYLIDLANHCHTNNLKFILKTNAYVNKEPWFEICKVTDAMNIDWKGNDEHQLKIVGAKKDIIEKRITEAFYAGVHLEISVPIYKYSPKDIEYFSKFISLLDKNIPCHILKIHPSYHFSEDFSQCDLAREIMSNYISNILIK